MIMPMLHAVLHLRNLPGWHVAPYVFSFHCC